MRLDLVDDKTTQTDLGDVCISFCVLYDKVWEVTSRTCANLVDNTLSFKNCRWPRKHRTNPPCDRELYSGPESIGLAHVRYTVLERVAYLGRQVPGPKGNRRSDLLYSWTSRHAATHAGIPS